MSVAVQITEDKIKWCELECAYEALQQIFRVQGAKIAQSDSFKCVENLFSLTMGLLTIHREVGVNSIFRTKIQILVGWKVFYEVNLWGEAI